MDPRERLLQLKKLLQEALKKGNDNVNESVRLIKEIQEMGAAVRFYPRKPVQPSQGSS